MVESKGFKSAWNRIQIELCFSCVSLGDPQNSVCLSKSHRNLARSAKII